MQTEFIVSRTLPRQRYPTPWAIGRQQVRDTFDRLEGMAEALLPWLSEEDRATVRADPRWWSAAAYSGREVEDLAQFETPEALVELAGMLAPGAGADPAEAEAEARAAILAAPVDRRLAVADALISRAVDTILDRCRRAVRRRKRELGVELYGGVTLDGR